MANKQFNVADLLTKTATREFAIDPSVINETDRTIDLSFSSETPVLQSTIFGDTFYEILAHDDGAVDLTRANDGASLLYNHDSNQLIGTIVKSYIEDRKGRALVRMSAVGDADNKFKQVLEGILTKTSVGYQRMAMEATGQEIDGIPVYRTTRWIVLECSLVAVPADTSTAIGRNLETNNKQDQEITQTKKVNRKMENETKIETSVATPVVDVEGIKRTVIETESQRVNAIAEYADAFDVSASVTRSFIADRTKTVKDFSEAVKAERAKQPVVKIDAGNIGMTPKEAQRFSISKALKAHRAGNWTGAEFEKEAIEASEKKNASIGRAAKFGGFFLPAEVAAKRTNTPMTKAGTSLVQTTVDGSGIFEYLFEDAGLVNLIGRKPSGLVGDVQYPVQTGAAGVSYIDPETGTVTQADASFGTANIKPKYAMAKVVIPQTLLRQSAIVLDSFLEQHIGLAFNDSIEDKIINGTGLLGTPTGLIPSITTSVDSNDTKLAYTDIVKLVTAIKKGHVKNNIVFVTTPEIEGFLASNPISTTLASTMMLVDGKVYGRPLIATTHAPSNTIIAGSFDESVLGFWNSVEIKLDEITGADSGALTVRGYLAYDFNIGRAAAFAKITDAIIA
jgi:HK97 family phage major capsid protein